MKKTPYLILSLAIIIFSISWIGFTPLMFNLDINTDDISAPHPGFPAHAFSLETIYGDSLSLADYKNQPVLIFFWASWCSVCKRTMPGIQSVYEEFSPLGFEILAVNTTFQDSLPSAVSYYNGQGYTFPFLVDSTGDVSRNYQMHALPTSILVNPEGIVLDVVIGSGLSESYLRSQIIEMLSITE